MHTPFDLCSQMNARCKNPKEWQDALYDSLIGRFNRQKPDEDKVKGTKRVVTEVPTGQPSTKKRKATQVILFRLKSCRLSCPTFFWKSSLSVPGKPNPSNTFPSGILETRRNSLFQKYGRAAWNNKPLKIRFQVFTIVLSFILPSFDARSSWTTFAQVLSILLSPKLDGESWMDNDDAIVIQLDRFITRWL